MSLRIPLLVVVVLVCGGLLAAAWASTASTASNVIPASRAGDGGAPVNAYSASGISWSLNAGTAYHVDSVGFTLTPAAAGSVRIILDGVAYGCANANGSVTCATTSPQAMLASLPTLQIVAAT